VTWSAVDDGHVPFVVARIGGRCEVMQPFDPAWARRTVAGPASDSPMERTLPSATSVATAPTVFLDGKSSNGL
jgi:hypothetical protein